MSSNNNRQRGGERSHNNSNNNSGHNGSRSTRPYRSNNNNSSSNSNSNSTTSNRKDSIFLDSQTLYQGQRIKLKFHGGRQVIGTLRGFDALTNLVLDECEEIIANISSSESGESNGDGLRIEEEKTRKLGLVVCRGTQVILIAPMEGMEEIENPFIAA